MNGKKLADRVLALGVGTKTLMESFPFLAPGVVHWTADRGMTANQFLRDWRVTGALMELAQTNGFCPLSSNLYFDPEIESLPLAIIEACVEGLDSAVEEQNHG